MANKQFLRSKDRWMAGVCGGLADYFGFDRDLVRIIYLLLTLCTVAFPGVLIYFILWLLVPEEK